MHAPVSASARVDADLLARVHRLGRLLQPTPTVPLPLGALRLHAKLEYANPSGSVKDRSAYWILKRAVERGEVQTGTTIVESSSGNFAVALATYAQLLGLPFIPVIDPNILPTNEAHLRRLCARVVKVDQRDDTGGFLKTRLAAVHHLCGSMPDAFWTNQYENEDAIDAHEHLTGEEICQALPTVDVAFIGVSTGGTLAGISRRLRASHPSVTIVAVDTVGSVVFGGAPQRRHIPGLGSSIVPPLVARAHVDAVEMVSEREAVRGCQTLLWEHGLFVGGSTGSCFIAAERYVARTGDRPATGVMLCADRGTAYLDTIFDPAWVTRLE